MLYPIIIILVALAPCLLWLWIIYKKDKYAPEPLRLIVITFLAGAAMVIPAAIIEYLLLPSGFKESLSPGVMVYQAFLVVGITEETVKLLAVRLAVYRSPHFNEPADGMVYSAAAALGFAALENVFYLINYGWATILLRGLTSNLAHVLFACLWGYPLVLYRLGRLKKVGWVWAGWLASVAAHGLFDFLLMSRSGLAWLAFPFFILMVVIFILMYRKANRLSPYRLANHEVGR